MTVSLEDQLHGAGLRVTAGRLAVLETLERNAHSDADTLHRLLTENGDSTSVQSIHNILGDLTHAGILRRIEPAGSAALYERRINDNHHHLVCTSCGAVADVDCVVGESPCLTPSQTSGYRVHSAEVTFWGVCEDCQRIAEDAAAT